MNPNVEITSSPARSAQLARKNIPYIVLLNEENRAAQLPDGAYCVENEDDIDEQCIERVYRRFHGLPWDIVQTKRLNIREITTEDVPRLYELYSDESVTRYMEPLFSERKQEMEYTRAYIENVYRFYGYGMWVIALLESGEVIGRVGLEFKEGMDGLALGFMLGAAYQHKGYAYEACAAVLEYARTQLEAPRIYVLVDRENAPSIRLCRRLGFAEGEDAEGGLLVMYRHPRQQNRLEKGDVS